MNIFYKYLHSFDRLFSKNVKWIQWILLALSFFLFYQYFDQAWNKWEQTKINWSPSFSIFFFIGFFWLIHHALETYLWIAVVKKSSRKTLSFKQALVMNWKALVMSLSTPFRVAEIPFRKKYLESLGIQKSQYQSVLQLFFIKPLFYVFVLGTVLLFSFQGIWVILGCFFLLVSIFATIFLFQKQKFWDIWIINLLRVLAYFGIHTFILSLMLPDIVFLELLKPIGLVHSASSFLPHFAGTDIIFKTALQSFLKLGIDFKLFSMSLVILWILNIFIPSIVGLFLKLKP
ncbi:MAG: hypothetical protein N4A45_05805 [Flavobacteriales bacterium]|jgi:hypothetical protein|nr:hypothetical protein [Flavobacteriales bacterium]